MKYLTGTGEMLDAICHKYYQGRTGATEAVLEANPGLAKFGPVLPVGTSIELPELEPVTKQGTVSLWD